MVPIYPVYQQFPQPMPGADPSRFPQPQMGPPMMALVLPNYLFPQMTPPMSQPGAAPGHFFNPNYNPGFPFTAPPVAAVPSTLSNPMPVPAPCAPSRSSTPQSYSQTPADREGAESPLFQSRCSSPLNLLQLEEPPCNRLEVATALAASQQAPPVQGGAAGVQASANQGSSDDTSKENGETQESNDAMSISSDLMDLLLAEDSRSGTGSAASGSGSSGTRSLGSGSGSNGCSSSGTSGTSSSQASSSQGSHTSKYFGSIDSSENDHSRKQPAGGGGEDQFIKCVLQDPIWLLMANTDNKIMMTYQLPARDMETVLREDREALRNLQKQQPRFTEEQKRELSQVHPWIRTGRLPRAINISGCAGCKSPPAVVPTTPFDVEIHEMELCLPLSLGSQEESADKSVTILTETNMDDVPPEDEEEGEEAGQGKATIMEDGSQAMTVEPRATAAAAVKQTAET